MQSAKSEMRHPIHRLGQTESARDGRFRRREATARQCHPAL